MPKVSVILSSYNHEKYISASIESVLNQTFTDFELLIFDDGSKDSSQEIIRSYNDKRIRLFLHSENIGPVHCFRECIKASTGKYIALQHSDDIWELDKLEKQIKFLDENPQYEVCFTQVKFIDESGEIYELPENHPYKDIFKQENRSRAEWLNHLFWKANCFCNPTMVIRNSSRNFVTAPFLFQLPDYFMWLNLCLKKTPYVLQDELISFRLRRESQNSVSSTSLEKNIRISNELYIVAKLFLKLFSDEVFFMKVFPEAKKFLVNDRIVIEFAFARFCLKRNLPAFQKLALEILYDLIHNDSKRKLIKKLYNYDEKKFIRDTGRFDVFGIKANSPVLNCRLYLDFGEGFSENNKLYAPTLIRPDGNFTAFFDFSVSKSIQRMRFDPDEKNALAIKISKITANGKIVEKFHANAFMVDDGYFNFITADPYFVMDYEIDSGQVYVEINGTFKDNALQNF